MPTAGAWIDESGAIDGAGAAVVADAVASRALAGGGQRARRALVPAADRVVSAGSPNSMPARSSALTFPD